MGNIVSGALTGVFIYITDMVLKQFVVGGGLMELIKFVVQGWLTVIFVESIEKFRNIPLKFIIVPIILIFLIIIPNLLLRISDRELLELKDVI